MSPWIFALETDMKVYVLTVVVGGEIEPITQVFGTLQAVEEYVRREAGGPPTWSFYEACQAFQDSFGDDCEVTFHAATLA